VVVEHTAQVALVLTVVQAVEVMVEHLQLLVLLTLAVAVEEEELTVLLAVLAVQE
jgi:hypothetical protein